MRIDARLAPLAVGITAALPSVVWAFAGGHFLHDDWSAVYDDQWVSTSDNWFHRAFEHPARPGGATYSVVSHHLFSNHPLPHLVLLAALNAAVALALLALLRRRLPEAASFAASLTFALLPNRSANRQWLVTAPSVLAVVLVLVGALVFQRSRTKAAVLFAIAVVTYEAVAGLIAVIAIVEASGRRHEGARAIARALLAAGPAAVLTIFMILISPKNDGPPRDISDSFVGIIPSNLTIGAFENQVVGAVALSLVVLVLVLAGLTMTGRRPDLAGPELSAAAVGAGALALIAGLISARGWSWGTDGIFDRANVVTGPAVGLLLGATILYLIRMTPVLGTAVGVVAGVSFVAGLVSDVAAYRAATTDGAALLQQIEQEPGLDRLLRPARDGCMVVVHPPLNNHDGVRQFIADTDLGFAMADQLDDQRIRIRIQNPIEGLFDGVPRYDRVRGVIEPASAGSECGQ